jgi:hypothetical protein
MRASLLLLYLRVFAHASALYTTGHYPLLFSPRSVQVSCTAHLSSLLFYRVLALTSSISCTSVVRHTKSADTLLASVYIGPLLTLYLRCGFRLRGAGTELRRPAEPGLLCQTGGRRGYEVRVPTAHRWVGFM